jgi:ABC-type Na+ transport system ATPase subunit NatA
MKQLVFEYRLREEDLDYRLKFAEDEFKRYKETTLKELELKDVLVDRQNNYINILKKELVYAKNIIKNPNLY